ncbi:Snurportin-1 [Psilocybe cubensis]|uniref:Snurportin-1 n=2 Tax=Psilocybe cubensis TaxID=181762 RepID=A0A8H8CGE4_PSICU|nr:Snurportin-1 [Psilocybe cubensis]KAH9477752.1 Snurportin-1 [Psilocybe cubensis]
MDRKTSYKLPPTTIRDKLVSQEIRRNKALEEQRRRRANKIDSARQLDLFADLNLGPSDDEDAKIDEEDTQEPEIRPDPGSIAHYAAMLKVEPEDAISASPSTATIDTRVPVPLNTDTPIETETSKSTGKKKSRGGPNRQKRRAKKASKWADRCMYAELLEMSADDPWVSSDQSNANAFNDGLPSDLESAWVAVAPVPVGKRCLAVTQQSAGVAGVVPNTTLRSRLLGKTLLPRFPSNLPPLTVLDCILDDKWRENGILHVLDVVKWKGQDVADCEAGFRFWWRDTRLAELAQSSPPSSINFLLNQKASSSTSAECFQKYLFPYPTTFIPVPYHATTTLSALDNIIIPAARSWRQVSISVPTSSNWNGLGEGGMEIEPSGSLNAHIPFQPHIALTSTETAIKPDGMLLYVAEASYEPGTSPLSSWIPIRGYDIDGEENVHRESVSQDAQICASHREIPEGPLDLFQRCVVVLFVLRSSPHFELVFEAGAKTTDHATFYWNDVPAILSFWSIGGKHSRRRGVYGF